MGNSKTMSTARRHRLRKRAAREKVRLHLEGKLTCEELPKLALRILQRRLRVSRVSRVSG
ncbi:MAG: hypothetical protein ACE5G2_11190 [Candidatus Krumholzibacteriia bacterium]